MNASCNRGGLIAGRRFIVLHWLSDFLRAASEEERGVIK